MRLIDVGTNIFTPIFGYFRHLTKIMRDYYKWIMMEFFFKSSPHLWEPRWVFVNQVGKTQISVWTIPQLCSMQYLPVSRTHTCTHVHTQIHVQDNIIILLMCALIWSFFSWYLKCTQADFHAHEYLTYSVHRKSVKHRAIVFCLIWPR